MEPASADSGQPRGYGEGREDPVGQHRGREDKVKGFYSYNPGANGFSLSRGHYAALGVWAAAQAGYDVPNSYWQLVEKSWIEQQDPSGGWAYRGKVDPRYPVTPGITADGIATLFITQDYLHADEAITPRGNIKNPAIDKAMAWMTSNFKKIRKMRASIAITRSSRSTQ